MEEKRVLEEGGRREANGLSNGGRSVPNVKIRDDLDLKTNPLVCEKAEQSEELQSFEGMVREILQEVRDRPPRHQDGRQIELSRSQHGDICKHIDPRYLKIT